jgi:hypothetical protein
VIERVDPAEVYAYLLQEGVSRIHALGMLANIKAESAFRVSVNELHPLKGQGGYGLFQHTGPRRRALFASVGGREPTWQEQIDFALCEHDTERYLSLEFGSPQEAAEWFVRHWERPADVDHAAKLRIAYAADLAAQRAFA